MEKKMDEERAERDKQEAERIEKINIEKKRWEEERAIAEKKEKERYEEERAERKRQEALELEKLKLEQLEISKKAQEELTKLENARLEFQRLEEERKQKIKEEQERIIAERELARKMIELVKSSRTPKVTSEKGNKKSQTFKNLIQVNNSFQDNKHLDLPTNSVLSTSIHTVNSSSKYFQSQPHPGRSSRQSHISKTNSESQMTDLPDQPSVAVPKQRLPLKKELAYMSRELGLDRFEENGQEYEDGYQEDLYSKSQSRGRLEGVRGSQDEGYDSVGYSSLQKETQKCWDKIKENAAIQREVAKKQFSIQENHRPSSRSNSASKEKEHEGENSVCRRAS